MTIHRDNKAVLAFCIKMILAFAWGEGLKRVKKGLGGKVSLNPCLGWRVEDEVMVWEKGGGYALPTIL